MGRMDGKVVFITGAARGQGRAHAIRLAQEGADIIAVDACTQIETIGYKTSSREDLKETVRLVEALDRRILPLIADVREQAGLDAAAEAGVAEFGRIDGVIANAGIWTPGKDFWEIDEDAWRDEVEINFNGVWRTCKACAPYMIERAQGSIVMISSNNGVEPGPKMSHYVGTKTGVLGLMRAFAMELGPYNVRVNAIRPGAMNTHMLNWQGAYDLFAGGPGGQPEDATVGGHHYTMLPHTSLMDPIETVSNAILFLLSDEAAKITGTQLAVDAGHEQLPRYNATPII